METFPVSRVIVLVLLSLTLTGCRKSAEKTAVPERTASTYIGAESCKKCHERESQLFSESDHAKAMDLANDKTVLGNFDNATFNHFGINSKFYKRDGKFFVFTEGAGGKLEEFEVKYVFGWRPLQQYLVEFSDGRVQTLPLCWDSRPKEQGGQRWFHIYDNDRVAANDILFWTRQSQNWNSMCAECHVTNLKKNYDVQSNTYKSTWSEIDVSCEACHGPGSQHVEWGEKVARGERAKGDVDKRLVVQLNDTDGGMWMDNPETGISKRSVVRTSHVQTEMCARCHSRRGIISEDYVHGKPLVDTHFPTLLEDGLYFADGQIRDEVYEYGSFLQSKMYAGGVVCSDCHSPHSGKILNQGNSLCMKCHSAEKYASTGHHFHKTNSTGAACIECHMTTRTYMVVDVRRDHSFRVPQPDLIASTGAPNACTSCHKDKSAEWAATALKKWYPKPKPKSYGEIFAAARRGDPDVQEGLLALITGESNRPMIKATAVNLLSRYSNQLALDTVRTALRDPDPLVRLAAVQSIEVVPENERSKLLVGLLRDPVRLLRILSARELAGVSQSLDSESLRLRDQLLKEYQQAQYLNADTPGANLNLGTLFLTQGDHPQAEAAYRRGIALEPGFIPSYLNLADLYRLQNKEGEAKSTLEKAYGVNPKVATVHLALGLLLARTGDQARAREWLASAVDLEPDTAHYSYVYAIALNSIGDSTKALSVLEKALQDNPWDRELLMALMSINRDRGDMAKAQVYADKLKKIYPESVDSR